MSENENTPSTNNDSQSQAQANQNETKPEENKAKPAVSKMPSFNEVTSMASKLFVDVKKSVTEIYKDYKDKRKEDASADTNKTSDPTDKK